MNPLCLLSSPVIDALGWTLVHALWQGFVLVLPVAILLHYLQHRASTLRYQLGVLTLLSQLLTSVATFVWCYDSTIASQPAVPPSLTQYAMRIQWKTVSQTLPWHQQVQHFLDAHLAQFVGVYLVGVILFGLRLAGGWVYLQHLSKTASRHTTKDWTPTMNQLQSLLSIKAVIQVRESSRIAVPMVIGLLKPVLLLPIGLATSLSVTEVEAVLAHELAHVKRHDYAVNLLQSVIEVLYFFHPALWWLSARVREEREHCCDDLAVHVTGGNGRILAQALARVEELRLAQPVQTPTLAMAFASRRHHLLYRVRRALGIQARPFVSNGSLAGLTVATLLLMSISVYAIQERDIPNSKASQPKPTRRLKIDKTSSYGLVDNKLSYVIWKGKKLSSTHVATLQRQLDQVMAGQLSLEAVPQPNHDILLALIEKRYGSENSLNTLPEDFSHIDYSGIVASALKDVPLSPDGTVEGLANVNYDSIIHQAFASLSVNTAEADTLEEPPMVTVNVDRDSLLELREMNQAKIAAIRQKIQTQQFAVETVERAIDRVERQKLVVEQKRFAEINRQHQVILQSASISTDSSRAALDKKINAGEALIKKTETELEALNQQLTHTQDELTKAKKLIREMELQIDKIELLDRQTYTTMGEAMATGTVIRSLHSNNRSLARPAVAPIPPLPIRANVSSKPVKPAMPAKTDRDWEPASKSPKW